ncbi:MAG: protein yceI precursor [Deltaproteobacteria bacterium]|nr:MAG: protein yceI precursor [Deltaproteobacteria bacterium]
MKKFAVSVMALAAMALLAVPSSAMAAPTKFNVDGGHSSVFFKVKHFGVGHFFGRFNKMKGQVHWGKNKKAVSIKVAAASIDTNNARRDKHLRSPDFFNAKRFRFISFKGNQVKKLGAGKFAVTGNLRLNGVTKKRTINFMVTGLKKDPYGNLRMGAVATFKVKRSNFGMTYGLKNKAIGNIVTITVSIEAVKAK